jgi:hypothetical protein
LCLHLVGLRRSLVSPWSKETRRSGFFEMKSLSNWSYNARFLSQLKKLWSEESQRTVRRFGPTTPKHRTRATTWPAESALSARQAPGLAEFCLRAEAFSAIHGGAMSTHSLFAFLEFRRFEFRGIEEPNPTAGVNSAAAREGGNVAPRLTPVEAKVEIHVREPGDGILPAIPRARLARLDEQEELRVGPLAKGEQRAAAGDRRIARVVTMQRRRQQPQVRAHVLAVDLVGAEPFGKPAGLSARPGGVSGGAGAFGSGFHSSPGPVALNNTP